MPHGFAKAERSMGRFPTFAWSCALAVAVAFQTAAPFAASADDDRWGLGYCAPPYPPKCAQSSSDGRPPPRPCAGEVDSYVASVFRYRTCLTREMERAVREANRTVEIIKCPTDNRFCYDLPTAKSP